ncbi:hypothetical protein DFH11DRAFT_1592362 [Phellopilus nigrolimitatus]|nr:hypothetical protein DFH11DRAFT_1592362 [Phellopilus nigrolimitatus]
MGRRLMDTRCSCSLSFYLIIITLFLRVADFENSRNHTSDSTFAFLRHRIFWGCDSRADNGRGFLELKKAFYVAIDVLSADVHASVVIVKGLIRAVDSNRGRSFRLQVSVRCVDVGLINYLCQDADIPLGHPLMNAERAFVLACVEQFVLVLSDACIEEDVLLLCEP